jgi:hypothetical protein
LCHKAESVCNAKICNWRSALGAATAAGSLRKEPPNGTKLEPEKLKLLMVVAFLPIQEIAIALGIKPKTAYARLRAARARLPRLAG